LHQHRVADETSTKGNAADVARCLAFLSSDEDAGSIVMSNEDRSYVRFPGARSFLPPVSEFNKREIDNKPPCNRSARER
jgi:hypothetical protein